MDNQKSISIGDKVELTGGYDDDPLYLKIPPADKRTGKIVRFIKGQNKEKAAVVRLDVAVTGSEITGDIAVLELR
jgi:hypothetical protein